MIAPAVLEHFKLDENQQRVVGHLDGPLVVVAGPGSGKTHCLVARTLNLLLLERARPERILLCTFTERATREMQDRLVEGARRVGYCGEISKVQVSTIHALSLELLRRLAPHTWLHRLPRTLDDIARRFFLERHFEKIVGARVEGRFLGRWETRSVALRELEDFFDRIADELIDEAALLQHEDAFFRALGSAYRRYRELLEQTGRIDFAHQQRLALELLEQLPAEHFFDYIMVDEYQDTNYIQEQLLLRLAGARQNLCVVGDEDQSLYRFRGATPVGFLSLPERLEGVRLVRLERNYRSHPEIIAAYDRWMQSCDWRGPDGRLFRYGKRMQPACPEAWEQVPALLRLEASDAAAEAEQIADLVETLHRCGKIRDWSEVAILLPSVRRRWSRPIIEALRQKQIPVWCPRARSFLEREETLTALGVLILLLDAVPAESGEEGAYLRKLRAYVLEAVDQALAWTQEDRELRLWIQSQRRRLEQKQRFRLSQLFYELLGLMPFRRWYHVEEKARRLALFSRLLCAFESEFGWHSIVLSKKDLFLKDFLERFLGRLVAIGVNEAEPEEETIPAGKVPVLTIHQAKGLEFPVVIVGGLSLRSPYQHSASEMLRPFYRRRVVEPLERLAEWDRRRLFYVAFSRAQQLLVLSASGRIQEAFLPIWEQARPWSQARARLLQARRFARKSARPVRLRLRFVEDVLGYAACPRRYQAFGYLGFEMIEEHQMVFGQLVHRVLESINRRGLSGQATIEEVIADLDGLIAREADRLAGEQGWRFNQRVLQQVREQALRYCEQARAWFSRIEAVEMPLTLELDTCVLTGSCDLLVREDTDALVLFDFKTSTHLYHSPEVLHLYWHQLAVYAHLVMQELKRPVSRLVLYWTAEEDPRRMFQERTFDRALHQAAMLQLQRYLDGIRVRRFRIERTPSRSLCRNCSMRWLCRQEGIRI